MRLQGKEDLKEMVDLFMYRDVEKQLKEERQVEQVEERNDEGNTYNEDS